MQITSWASEIQRTAWVTLHRASATMQVVIIVLTCIVLLCICLMFCLYKNICTVKCYSELGLPGNSPTSPYLTSPKIVTNCSYSRESSPTVPIQINRTPSIPTSQYSLDNPGYILPLSRHISQSMHNLYLAPSLSHIYEEVDQNNNTSEGSSGESNIIIIEDSTSDSAFQSA